MCLTRYYYRETDDYVTVYVTPDTTNVAHFTSIDSITGSILKRNHFKFTNTV